MAMKTRRHFKDPEDAIRLDDIGDNPLLTGIVGKVFRPKLVLVIIDLQQLSNRCCSGGIDTRIKDFFVFHFCPVLSYESWSPTYFNCLVLKAFFSVFIDSNIEVARFEFLKKVHFNLR